MSFDGWQEVSLDEIADMKYGKMPKKEDIVEKGYPIFSGYRITGYHKEYMFEESQLIVVARGVGGTGDVKLSPPNCYLTNLSIAIILNEQIASKKYLYYYFQKLNLRSLDTGSAQSQITISDLKRYKVTLPPLAEQKAIAATLSALDDMIELNNQINKTLEEMAQALFKSWFVDFEPFKEGEFEESELGLIPKGWKVGTVGDLCTDIFSGGTPLTSNPKFWNGKHPWLASGETRTSIIVKTEKSITDEGVVNSSTRLAKKYDIVIASAGQGHTRGQTAITLIDTYINQSVIALRAEVYGYLFCNLRNRYNELRAISDSSSIRGSLTTKIMKQFPILLPPEEVLRAFQGIFEEIIEYCGQSALQNVTLSEIRDTLLPKLMSGEIRVPVEEVV